MTTPTTTESSRQKAQSLLRRLWVYQAERFPLARLLPLLAVFSAASITVSAVLGGRPLPGWGAYLAGFVVLIALFFQMRAADEVKDLEDDTRYRPERPIPRGLVSLRLIVALGWVCVPFAGLVAWLWYPPLLWLLALVWIWLAAMSLEFGVPEWLRVRPIVYLVSHMLIMPLIDLLLTGFEWLPHGAAPHGLVLFLGLSFANGCVVELGRKIWAPGAEREGVETYSSAWGVRRAVLAWIGVVATSYLLLIGVGWATHAPFALALIGAPAFGFAIWTARSFYLDQTLARQNRLDLVAGLWVFFCYSVAGFVPAIIRALP